MSVIPQEFVAVRAYHKATKHRLSGYAPSPGFLDWDSQPNPFRAFQSCDIINLPLVLGAPDIPFGQLFAPTEVSEVWDINYLAKLLELSAGLSAWKSDGMSQWALRNNPSSGNLHPTEFYIFILQAPDAQLPPGLYHYMPKEHALERRAILAPEQMQALIDLSGGAKAVLALSSVIWREEWKYGARALRYCQHDVGHALAAARFAAQVCGWHMGLDINVGDTQLAACLGLNRTQDFENAEGEHADAAVLVHAQANVQEVQLEPKFWQLMEESLQQWSGKANRLSNESIRWPQIASVLSFIDKPSLQLTPLKSTSSPYTYSAHEYTHSSAQVIRKRRSAQRMNPEVGLSFTQFETLLGCTLAQSHTPPFDIWPLAPAIHLMVYVHEVEGLQPGLYCLVRNQESFEQFIQACEVKNYVWQAVADTKLPLYQLEAPLNLRKLASQLHCYQGIAGKGAFCVDMIAEMGSALKNLGSWAYRSLYWEAGMIGQALYLQAEAFGFRGTGIGCFFDDEIHSLMGLDAEGNWQTLYGFTVGDPVEDHRLTSVSAYRHLKDRSL